MRKRRAGRYCNTYSVRPTGVLILIGLALVVALAAHNAFRLLWWWWPQCV